MATQSKMSLSAYFFFKILQNKIEIYTVSLKYELQFVPASGKANS